MEHRMPINRTLEVLIAVLNRGSRRRRYPCGLMAGTGRRGAAMKPDTAETIREVHDLIDVSRGIAAARLMGEKLEKLQEELLDLL
jgi:hypothetical protein